MPVLLQEISFNEKTLFFEQFFANLLSYWQTDFSEETDLRVIISCGLFLNRNIDGSSKWVILTIPEKINEFLLAEKIINAYERFSILAVGNVQAFKIGVKWRLEWLIRRFRNFEWKGIKRRLEH